MARISLNPPRSLTLRLAEWYSKRKYGKVLDPIRAIGHYPAVLRDGARFELRVGKWNALDPVLRQLALMASAARIGCSWCVDFGYWLGYEQGLPMERLRHVPQWREHRDAFSELELLVLEFAEAMCETEPAVTDEMAEELVGRLGERAFVELVSQVSVENFRSRTNAALGLVGQGFSDRCAVPLHAAADGADPAQRTDR